ncbi:hypothetical protein SRB17_04980 [Streptomyces sp. RB17]|nr:hypothetical protein [Streptomyces sp. RB17]
MIGSPRPNWQLVDRCRETPLRAGRTRRQSVPNASRTACRKAARGAWIASRAVSNLSTKAVKPCCRPACTASRQSVPAESSSNMTPISGSAACVTCRGPATETAATAALNSVHNSCVRRKRSSHRPSSPLLDRKVSVASHQPAESLSQQSSSDVDGSGLVQDQQNAQPGGLRRRRRHLVEGECLGPRLRRHLSAGRSLACAREVSEACASSGCGAACPQMDTAIQIGSTGKKLLPLTVKNAGPTPASSGHAH